VAGHDWLHDRKRLVEASRAISRPTILSRAIQSQPQLFQCLHRKYVAVVNTYYTTLFFVIWRKIAYRQKGKDIKTQRSLSRSNQKTVVVQPLQSLLLMEASASCCRNTQPQSEDAAARGEVTTADREAVTSKTGLWKSQLVAAPVLRSHNRCYLSCDHTIHSRPVVR